MDKIQLWVRQVVEACGLEGDGVAYVRLTGACAQCPTAQETLESVVKDFVMGGCPEVKDVVLDTSVSEDLLDFARKILRGEMKND